MVPETSADGKNVDKAFVVKFSLELLLSALCLAPMSLGWGLQFGFGVDNFVVVVVDVVVVDVTAAVFTTEGGTLIPVILN